MVVYYREDTSENDQVKEKEISTTASNLHSRLFALLKVAKLHHCPMCITGHTECFIHMHAISLKL